MLLYDSSLRYITTAANHKCDSSTVGSTPPCQGGGRGFEPRLSLSKALKILQGLFVLIKLECAKPYKRSCRRR